MQHRAIERLINYVSLIAEISLSGLSAFLFGNAAGIANNRLGERLLSEAKKARGDGWQYEDPAAQDLTRLGYARLKISYDAGLIDRLSKDLDRAINDPQKSAPSNQAQERKHPEASRSLLNPLETIPDLALLIDDNVRNVLWSYFGGHFQWTQTVVYRTFNIPDESKEVYSNIWHFDRLHTAYLQLFVYLSPNVTAEETGAFRIHSRSSSREILRKGFLHRRIMTKSARRMLDDPSRVDCIEGVAGTAFITANAWCLHRAGVPKPQHHRDVAVFSLIPSTEPFDGKMRPSPVG
jgi:hypothetical protein